MMTDDGAKTANGPAVENFASVSASGQDLTIKLKSPQASMLDNPVPIMPKHVWEKVGDIAKYEAERRTPPSRAGRTSRWSTRRTST